MCQRQLLNLQTNQSCSFTKSAHFNCVVPGFWCFAFMECFFFQFYVLFDVCLGFFLFAQVNRANSCWCVMQWCWLMGTVPINKFIKWIQMKRMVQICFISKVHSGKWNRKTWKQAFKTVAKWAEARIECTNTPTTSLSDTTLSSFALLCFIFHLFPIDATELILDQVTSAAGILYFSGQNWSKTSANLLSWSSVNQVHWVTYLTAFISLKLNWLY